ncbi:hypothetical protein ABZ404_37225 [Streptomyces sp. NPDC005878]|uniref:hypothetical protein n=1 Tax=Streptomyces sp. NPDC005878 TaxID=3157077 RepID=UPI0033D75F6B
MPNLPARLLLAVLSVLAAAGAFAWREHRRHRAVRTALAAAQLQQAALHRDMDAFTSRIQGALNARAVLIAADSVLDEALAAHSRHQPTRKGDDDPWTR